MSKKTLYNYQPTEKPLITDEEYIDVGANVFQFGEVKRAFIEESFILKDSLDNVLVLNTDYEFADKDSRYSSEMGMNVWVGLKILNPAYQTGTLKPQYRCIGSYTDANFVSTGGEGAYDASPVGAILPYAGDSAPDGWLLTNGETIGNIGSGADHEGSEFQSLFNIVKIGYGNTGTEIFSSGDTVKIPDTRGIFLSGAGVHGSLLKANGTAYNRLLGDYENDQMQGHFHSIKDHLGNTIGDPGQISLSTGADILYRRTLYTLISAKDVITDGTNGTPRTGSETNPANLAVNYIIKYANVLPESEEVIKASVPIGLTSHFAGVTAPSGWLLCEGKTLGKVGSGADYEGSEYRNIFDIVKNGNGNTGLEVFDDGDIVKLPKKSKTIIDSYDTGDWINRTNWANSHLGSVRTLNANSNINHNFNTPFSNLIIKLFISHIGSDSDSFEIKDLSNSSGGYGYIFMAVDNNNIKVQTGENGLTYMDDNGAGQIIRLDNKYYRICVYKLQDENFIIKYANPAIVDPMPTASSQITVTSDYTVTDDDGINTILIDASLNSVNVTMADSVNNINREIKIITVNDTFLAKVSGTIEGMTEIHLPKKGNFIKLLGTSAEWIIEGEKIACQLRLSDFAGYGDVNNNKIMRFSIKQEGYGNCFEENHSSGYEGNTKGLKFLIKKDGKYSFSHTMVTPSSGGNVVGFSKNSTTLSTSITAINTAHKLAMACANSAGTDEVVASWTGYLKRNEFVHLHTNGGIPVNNSNVLITATYLGG